MAKNLPGISSKLPSDVRQFLDRVREFISTTAADFVSRSELESAGVITTDAYGRTLAGAQNEVSQLSPPAPTGVTATGAMTNILVEWDEAAYPNHSYAEIWASGTDDLGAAVMVGESTATMFAHAVGTGVTRYYWVRFVSTANVAGPFNAISGVHGQTSNDPAWMLEVLAGQLSETQLVSALNTRIDLIDALPSVSGSVNARIAAETEARIAALSAEIADRNVAISNEARQRIDDVQATAESVLRNAVALHNEAILRTGDVATARFELTENLQTGLLAEATARLTLEARVSNTEASVTSEQTARADGDTANANSINSLYSQVNDPVTGLPSAIAAINAEATSRADGDLAESSARDILAAQLRGDYTGTDVAMLTSGLLYAEKLARATEDLALAQQITLLSAGAGEQFDWKSIWYFDSGIEGWGGNGAPTASAGWLRPADDGADPYATSPTGIGADGAKYSQMRLRIRKTGAPTWDGFLWWRAAADSTWDTSRRVALTEPTYDVHGIGLITVSPGWAITVDRVRIDLSTAQSGTDYFEIDWVAIGRPSPGASSAQLLDEQTARANADSSEVSARQSLSAKLTGATDPSSLTLGTLASGLIFDERQARASADGAMSTLITQLRTDVDGNAADITIEQTARSDADSAEVTARQALSAKLTGTNDPSSLTLATLASGLIFDEKNARVTEDAALAYSLSILSGQVGDNAGAILDEQTARANGDSATASDIHTLYATSRALSFADQQAAEAAIRAALAIDGQRGAADQTVAVLRTEMRTEFSEGISAEATARTLLAAAVDANAAAIQTEQTARTNADGAIADNFTALQTTVGGHTLSIASQQQSIDGIHGLYIVKIDNNGVMSGFALASDVIANGSVLSKFILSVDQFAVIAPGRTAGQLNSVPFAVLTTAQTINGVDFTPGVYIDGGSINHLSVGTAQLADLAVDNGKIANLSAEKITAGDVNADRMRANIVSAASGQFDTLSALSSALGTILIDGGGWLKTNGVTSFTAGSGAFMGYDAGAYKYRVGNMVDRFMSWDGIDLTIKSPGLDIENGNATFSGHLEAASGTFTGELYAATGTFGGRLLAGVVDLSFANGVTQIFTSPGAHSIQVPADMNSVRITVVGAGAGGGNGGGYFSYAGASGGGGGGGGAGSVVTGTYPASVTPGQYLSLYVGIGGNGGNGQFGEEGRFGLDGSDGEASYVTGFHSAAGGTKGKGGTLALPLMISTAGGLGGSLGGVAGSAGTDTLGDVQNAGKGGTGGSTGYAVGGAGNIIRTYRQTAFIVHRTPQNGGAGEKGSGGGGGSGGAIDYTGDWLPAGHGGPGGDGIVIIEFYNQNSVVMNSTFQAFLAKYNALCLALSQTSYQY